MAKSTTAVSVPSPFTALAPQADKPLILGEGSSPYITFAHPLSKSYGAITAALKRQPKPSEAVYFGANNAIMVLDPFLYVQTGMFAQYFGKQNQDGGLEEIQVNDGSMRCPRGLQDILFTIVILVIDGVAYPARVRAIGPKTRGFMDSINFVTNYCTADDWSGLSKDHKLTVQPNFQPWMYAEHQCQLVTTPPKAPIKPGAKPYEITEVTSRPCSLHTIKAIKDAMVSDSFKKLLQDCIDSHIMYLPKVAE